MRVRTLVWLLGLSFACSPAEVAADDGHERTKKLIERIDETVKEMREGRKRMEKTLEAYHEMFSREDKDRRSSFEDVVEGLEKQEERSKKLEERFEQLEKEAEKYFKSWNKSLKDIKDGELRDRSAARLDDARRRYEELIRAGEEVQNGYRPLVRGLQDQIVYLEHDLNQAAVDSLQADRADTNDLARSLMARIDGYAAAADAYVASLKR